MKTVLRGTFRLLAFLLLISTCSLAETAAETYKTTCAMCHGPDGKGSPHSVVGFDAPGNTKQNVPQFIAAMIPHFNKEGWLSGIAFNDSMHFEVADETIKWFTLPELSFSFQHFVAFVRPFIETFFQ